MTTISAHDGLGSLPNKLKELWLEIGGSCHLKCEYCFAQSGGIDRSKDNVTIERLVSALKEFKEMGGERIAVVGAGEPFHPRNIKDLYTILDYSKSQGLRSSIFTTADLISEKVLDRLDNYKDITLLVKYNSSIPEIQDKLVQSPGYTMRREKALERLIERGYNDGKRLGIVTSVMKDNSAEVVDLLRYARKNNLIFDADTIIPRGRGADCGLQLVGAETKEVLKQLQKVDKEEFGNEWDITSSYVGSPPCTRFNQHMYIDKTGNAHPCVSSTEVSLGSVKYQGLKEIWDSDLMKIVRDHKYVGKCTTCKNYQEKKCYSCLGRSTEDLTTDSLKKCGYVKTVGCFNFTPGEK